MLLSFFQSKEIRQLQKQIRCLEFGVAYVGDEFCGR